VEILLFINMILYLSGDNLVPTLPWFFIPMYINLFIKWHFAIQLPIQDIQTILFKYNNNKVNKDIHWAKFNTLRYFINEGQPPLLGFMITWLPTPLFDTYYIIFNLNTCNKHTRSLLIYNIILSYMLFSNYTQCTLHLFLVWLVTGIVQYNNC
jgi:hypothetical protein